MDSVYSRYLMKCSFLITVKESSTYSLISVITTKTKKNKQVGYNGSLTLGYGQGFFPKFNEALVFNYRKGKFNFFTNLSHNYRKGFQELDIQRKFMDKNSKELKSYFDQEARM